LQYTHTHFLNNALSNTTRAQNAGPCCFPTDFAPLQIVYLNDKREVIVASMPNMVAKTCGCA